VLHFDPGAAATVPERLEPLAQSVLSEAMRNVRKHASATEVRIDTRRVDGTFVLEVSNDGVSARGDVLPGMGLRLAAFEALQVGGIVEFGPRGSDGWQVRLVVPYDG
jgi:signal transduction histidine kinase